MKTFLKITEVKDTEAIERKMYIPTNTVEMRRITVIVRTN